MIPALEPLTGAGAKPVHVEHALRAWLGGVELEAHARRPRLAFPGAALERLPEVEARLDSLVRAVEASEADDGSVRELLELSDGRRIECVHLPRGGLCVSSQVGCAVGCEFCATGRLGLVRNLEVEELLAQIARARRRGRLRRVVFMGMGEPAHNLAKVVRAIELAVRFGELPRKELVFSTVGDPRAFDALAAAPLRPALALSLHTTDAELRARLLPRAPRVEPRELLERALDYAALAGHPLQLQWTLLAGLNDTDEEIARLAEWTRGRRVVVDFIDFNASEGLPFVRTSRARTLALTHALHAAGVLAKLRHSAGQDARGGCGQLDAVRRMESD